MMDAPRPRPVHLVGSVPLQDSEAVFRALAATLGVRAQRYPDGETGVRSQWIRWQRRTFEDHPDFAADGSSTSIGKYSDSVDRPFYRLRAGVEAGDVSIGDMGYARAAVASYAVFSRLRRDGVVPPSVRFLVSLPTTTALVGSFFRVPRRAAVEPIVENALAREVAAIVDAIPADRLAIQWDVCHEVVGADGGMPLHYGAAPDGEGAKDAIVAASRERAARHVDFVPPDVEAGIHLCYGDPGHRHIIEPADLGTCVALANGVVGAAGRRVDFIHMPVPRSRDDDAYFAPLEGLSLPAGTELYLGLVHHTDGAGGARRRIAAAARRAASFGIATECGFGRRDPATIPSLLAIHAEASDDSPV